MANDLITELDRLHHRATDMRARERQLAYAGENDPASDAWKTAAILAASAESEFEIALVEAWPALAALLREAGGWRPIDDQAKLEPQLLLGVVRNGVLEEIHLGGYHWAVNEDEESCWWSDQSDDEIAPTHFMFPPAIHLGVRCEDCPPPGYPTDRTRCAPCDRRAPADGSCVRCGCVPRNASGLCATCVDEDAVRAGEVEDDTSQALWRQALGQEHVAPATKPLPAPPAAGGKDDHHA